MGGITSRSGSLGWSWWTPWKIQCSRVPSRLFGSRWKTERWIQYSAKVQDAYPPRKQSPASHSGRRVSVSAPRTMIVGAKNSSGMIGRLRVNRSSLEEKSGGEARRTSERVNRSIPSHLSRATSCTATNDDEHRLIDGREGPKLPC